MSTCIEVLPVRTLDISFDKVLSLSEKNINAFLASIGVHYQIELVAYIHAQDESYQYEVRPNQPFFWKDTEYLWLTIKGVQGGTDGYCYPIIDNDDKIEPYWKLDYLKEEILAKHSKSGVMDKTDDMADTIKGIEKHNQSWTFRRSAGQSAIICISYGLIACAVAELTDGILFSDDGAWDYHYFPCDYSEFLAVYFRPDKTNNQDCQKWAIRCIEQVQKEFG
ncbi:hypothetical protein [Psychrobacter sp. I-STPA6b]|uniref:hypothetical protein n=1 Tax=Psychrobacter sp. I-STPA6b TaxID=2585718 RepID=UPI001D0CA030|nr:hypothetical protein [Psychrobacter sp. I-STPA6b]